MKCPLRHEGKAHESSIYQTEFMDCLQAECAWWSQAKQACCISALSTDVWILAEALRDLGGKIPFGGGK